MKLFTHWILCAATFSSTVVLGDLLGSACDPTKETSTCSSDTMLLSCDQNTWVFQSNCTLGTQCRSGACIQEDAAQAQDSAEQASKEAEGSTTVFSPLACPFVRAYGDEDGKYDDCVAYSEYWASVTKEGEERSEGYFTFTLGSDVTETTSGCRANGWGALGALGMALVAAAAAL